MLGITKKSNISVLILWVKAKEKFRIFSSSLLLSVFLSISSCGPGSDSGDINIFSDNTDSYTGVSLFTFLNPYPVVKSFFVVLDPVEFNNSLGDSLAKAPREDNLGAIRASQSILLESRTSLQSLASGLADLIDRMENSDPVAYAAVQPLFERMRNYPNPIVRNLVPVSRNAILQDYNYKTKEEIQTSIKETANTLADADTVDFIKDIEDFLYKGLETNPNFRSGLEDLLNGFFAPSALIDRSIKNDLIGIVYDLGNMMFLNAGFIDQISSQTALKQLIVNLEKYYTVGGQVYDSGTEYSAPGGVLHSSELSVQLRDLFLAFRNLILAPNSILTVTPGLNFLDEISKNLYALDFPKDQTGAGTSLGHLIRLDAAGLDRAYDSLSSSVSALESLFVVLFLADNYGYTMDLSNTTDDYIISATGGEFTLGDGLYSLKSILAAPAGNDFNFKNITQQSQNSSKVFRDGSIYKFGLNTRVFSMLEDKARGRTAVPSGPTVDITSGSGPYDKVFNKTLPWILDWIVNVTFRGYGPYYNKNRKDGGGNFLSPDGNIARYSGGGENLYSSSWTTHRYDILLNPNSNNRCVSMGGYQTNTNCSTPDSSPGAGLYTIVEVPKSDSERAVDSDEEAFYKNLQWLLYEKRFVAVIPMRAKISATVAFEEAIFILAVGNGIMGMLNLSPNCGPKTSATTTSCQENNGKWKIAGTGLKDDLSTGMVEDYSTTGNDLQTFSNIPADSVILVEGWGYGLDGNGSFQVTAVYSALWPLMVPDPSSIYGLIPPVISQNAGVLSLLGFLTSSTVAPSQTGSYWSDRNQLTPFVVALAKSLLDGVAGQTTATPQNPTIILSQLTEVLSRPYAFYGPDTSKGYPSDDPTPLNIYQIRTNGIEYGLRNPEASPSDYVPNSNYRSLVSILSEKDRRYQDGVLNILSKSDLLSDLISFVSNLGDPSKSDSSVLVLSGFKKIMEETLVLSECPASNEAQFESDCPSKFNIESVTTWFRDKIAVYPDTRPSDVYDVAWSDVEDFAQNLRDYLSSSSGWSIVGSMDFLLDLLLDIHPSNAEVSSTFDLVVSLLINPDLTRPYTITELLTESLPPTLNSISTYGRNLYGAGYYLSSPEGFFSFLEKKSRMNPNASVADLFEDFRRLLSSDMIHTSKMDSRSFLYSAGTMLQLFGDIYEVGRKFSAPDAFFYDSWNSDQPDSSYWDNMNLILSER